MGLFLKNKLNESQQEQQQKPKKDKGIISNYFATINNKYKLNKTILEKQIKVLESMPDFAKDADEDLYTILNAENEEYDESDLDTLRTNANKLYYTSPLARGVIECLVNFIIGKTFKIVPEDDCDQVIEYWDKFYKTNRMDNRSKEWVRRTLKSGEVFVRMFNGKKVPYIRFIQPAQIKDTKDRFSHGIETDPKDIETIINYYREWNDKNGQPHDERISAKEMIHTKILVDSDVKRGISILIGVSAYIKKYEGWLNDRIHLNKIRTVFNLIGKPTGGSPSSAFANQFTDSTKKSTNNSTDYKKKLPKSGTIVISKGMEYDFKSLNLNAGDTRYDGRAILLMIVSGVNLAEYMVTGDASNANYASTMVAESPAVRAFEAWQDFFEEEFKELFRRVIAKGRASGDIPDSYEHEIEYIDDVTGEMKTKTETVKVTGECSVQYPSLIHRDIEKETKALAIQVGTDLASKKTASTKLGYDYDEEQKQIKKERLEDEPEEELITMPPVEDGDEEE